MKITALVENNARGTLRPVHGLALYIETRLHKLLFDLGPDDTLFHNAALRGIDLAAVDTVILSHGHYDHGGALRQFLEVNSRATVYVQRSAFLPHFGMDGGGKRDIGLDPLLLQSPRLCLLEGDTVIDEELQVFVVTGAQKCHSPANDTLYQEDAPDAFVHEQNLILTEEGTALIMGCGHTGIVNILEKAERFRPSLCIGGFHLHNPKTNRCVDHSLLEEIAGHLRRYPGLRYYTCHCTGPEAYAYLAERVEELHYLACGDAIT